MSTLQHTSQFRERGVRRLVLITVVALIIAAGIAAVIVAIASGGSSVSANASPVVNAQPMYMGSKVERDALAGKKAEGAHAASQNLSGGDNAPTPQTSGHRP